MICKRIDEVTVKTQFCLCVCAACMSGFSFAGIVTYNKAFYTKTTMYNEDKKVLREFRTQLQLNMILRMYTKHILEN